jgi:hypothetical protein
MPWRRVVEWMYRSTDYWLRHYLEVRGQLHAPAALLPEKDPPVPIGLEARWAPEAVWMTWRRWKSRPYRVSNSEPSAVQPVASCCADCAVAAKAPCTLSKFGNVVELRARLNNAVASVTNPDAGKHVTWNRVPSGHFARAHTAKCWVVLSSKANQYSAFCVYLNCDHSI